MSREKVLRKKLLEEPDEFLSRSQQLWAWVHAHRRTAALVGGGVAAVVLLAIGVKGYADRSGGQRANAVAMAVTRYTQAPNGAVPAELRQELAALADRYAGTPEGAVARLFQAGALAAAGETEKARQSYAALTAAGAGQGDIALLARQALAYLDLASGAVDAALSAFQGLLQTRDGAIARTQIMLEIAAIHEKQGRAPEARRIYQEILDEHPEGSWTTTAKDRLRILNELASAAS